MARIPKYKLDKASGRARIQINGVREYLPGAYKSDESLAAYAERISALRKQTADSSRPIQKKNRKRFDITVVELLAKFLVWAEEFHSKDEFKHYKAVANILDKIYGRSQVADFGPVAFKCVRTQMVARDWCRRHVNQQAGRLRRIFRMGVELEIVPVDVWRTLTAVRALREGEIVDGVPVRESKGVESVDWSAVASILPFLSPCVAAMVQLQWLSGMRPGETCRLRGCEIDRDKYEPEWIYKPSEHKTKWRGKKKLIFFGPQAQGILLSYIVDNAESYLFPPELSFRQQLARRTKSDDAIENGVYVLKIKRKFNSCFNVFSYRQAILHGINKARNHNIEVSHFHPHQLRHTRAEETQERYGTEGAAAQTGNTIQAAQIYAERNIELARRIARETG